MKKLKKFLQIIISLIKRFDQEKFFRLVNFYIIRFTRWKDSSIDRRYFIYGLSIFVGVLSGFCAVFIKTSVHLVESLVTYNFKGETYNGLYFVLPAIGIAITQFILRFFIKDEIGHGVPNTLYAISKNRGNIKKNRMYASVITSAFTVGFGGSSGLEGPTVGTTSAVSSNLGKLLRLDYKTKILLIGCAASGSLAAIFKAPVAAIVFALEVIMLDLKMSSLIPLLMASAAAAITTRIIYGSDLLFHFTIQESFETWELPFYILLGILAGLFSVYFTKVFSKLSKFFDKLNKPWKRWFIGSSILGTLLFAFPALYGEGYKVINLLIENDLPEVAKNSYFYKFSDNTWMMILFLVALLFLKVIATTVTFGAGGVGGIFAPTLFMGAVLGYAFVQILSQLGLEFSSAASFTLVAMAATMASNLHAPLTAIFLIAEITGGYSLFIPLIVASSVAYVTMKTFVSHSVYTYQLAKRGELLTHDKDSSVLTLMDKQSLIETDFTKLNPYQKLADCVETITKANRNIFPVLDEKNRFLGIVLLSDIKELLFDKEKHQDYFIHELMTIAPEIISSSDGMDIIMKKFESSQAWYLPIVVENLYVGFISKSKLFDAYRQVLKMHYREED